MPTFYPECRAGLSIVFDGLGRESPALGGKTQPLVMDVLPRSCTVHSNGYKEADTFEMEFDAASLPLTPEQISSMEVTIYMFSKTSLTDPFKKYVTEDNLAFVGLVDSADTTWSSDGRTFRIEGRDYTSLMIDFPWDPSERVPLGKNGKLLDKLVEELAARTAGFKKRDGSKAGFLKVDYRAKDRKGNPIKIPKVDSVNMFKTKSKGQHFKSGTTYWDVIYGICLSHGFIVFVDKRKIVITTPGSQVTDGLSNVRHMAYGKNLASLSVERKLGKETVPQVVASAWNPRTRERVRAVFPNKQEQKSKLPGIGTKRNERIFVTPPQGVTSKRELKRYAESYYNNLARGEATWRFTTHYLRDLQDQEMLGISAGNGVLIEWAAFNKEEFKNLDVFQRTQKLLDLGYRDTVAAAIAQNYDLIVKYNHVLYVREATKTWDQTNGMEITAELVNFIAPSRDEVTE